MKAMEAAVEQRASHQSQCSRIVLVVVVHFQRHELKHRMSQELAEEAELLQVMSSYDHVVQAELTKEPMMKSLKSSSQAYLSFRVHEEVPDWHLSSHVDLEGHFEEQEECQMAMLEPIQDRWRRCRRSRRA